MGVGGGEAALPGALDSAHPTLVPRYLEGQAAVTIQHVACGDLFTACLTGEVCNLFPALSCHASAAVCGLVGQDAAHVLGQASLSPMLEGEGSIPVRDVGFSPLIIICDTD